MAFSPETYKKLLGSAPSGTTLGTLKVAVDQILQSIADEYDPTATYSVGALVRYNGKLYRCNTTISTPEPWTAAHWTEVDIEDEITELRQLLAGKANKMAVATTLPATAVVNTIYTLGSQSAITTALPAGTAAGDVIVITWANGATAATVTITGTMIPFSFTPSANKQSEIDAMWNGTAWSLVSNEQALS